MRRVQIKTFIHSRYKSANRSLHKLTKKQHKLASVAGICALVIGVGAVFALSPHADTSTSASFDAENGTRSGVSLVSDASAAGGGAVMFGASGTNILQGKTFTANVSDSTTETGNPIANMTDGNDNTRWISQPTRPVAATVDMAGVYTLNRVQIIWAADTIKDFSLQVSSDNSAWTTITTGVTNNTTKQDVNYTTFSATAKGRYLRINGTSAWNNAFGNSIWEVRAYGILDETVPDPPNPPVNGKPGVGMMVFVNQSTWARDLQETVASGATWIRMDIPIGIYGNVTNGVFYPDQNQVNFYRQAAQQADAAGLKIVLVMAAAYNSDAWSEQQFRDYNGQYWKAVSQNIGQYVDLWQIFNEHDGRDYRNHAPVSLTAAYLDRMRLALLQARTELRKHSNAPITTTPFGYPVDEARYTKWQTFFDGVGPSLDVIGVHAYPEKSATVINRVPTYINRLKARYNKPVAVLEYGLPSVAGYGTEAEVGKAITDQIAAIMSAEPMTATLYQLRDRGTDSNNGEMVFGVLRNDFTKKSYYNAVVAEVNKWR